MMKNKKTISTLVSGLAVGLACGGTALGQSADALIDKLVQKGVLSVKEGNELREESDKDFTKAYSSKNGMPEWVQTFKLNGDFRGRAEDFGTDNTSGLGFDRLRYRYRLRVGATATLLDDFEVGLRLTSADPASGSTAGGNPLSNNTTFQGNGTKKFVYIDAAYAKWTPIHSSDLTLSGTIGKMDSPFEISNMVLDYDYQPEGAALQSTYNFNDKQALRLNAGYFALNELSTSSRDPAMLGAQLLWDAKWTPKVSTTMGVTTIGLNHKESLGNAAANNLPNQNTGNTRDANGNLVHNYNPVIGSASVTYKLASFPLYNGEFPIRFGGEYMENPSTSSQNTGYWLGVTLGKAGTKHNWDISYKYQELRADAWYEEVVDDDNVGFYQVAHPGDGTGTGYRGGTGVRGNVIKADYSFNSAVTLTFTCYLNELIDPPLGLKSGAQHFMLDLNFKF